MGELLYFFEEFRVDWDLAGILCFGYVIFMGFIFRGFYNGGFYIES